MTAQLLCQVDKAQRHVDDAVAKGATVLTGGGRLPELGNCFFAPTVLAEATPEMLIFREVSTPPHPRTDSQLRTN